MLFITQNCNCIVWLSHRFIKRDFRAVISDYLDVRDQPIETAIYQNIKELECGPMPNVMVALPNIGGALCSTPQSLADAHY